MNEHDSQLTLPRSPIHNSQTEPPSACCLIQDFSPDPFLASMHANYFTLTSNSSPM